MVKNLPSMQETSVQFLGQEDTLEKEIATLSSILAWRIPWTKESSGLQSMGSQRVRYDWVTNTFAFFSLSQGLCLLTISPEWELANYGPAFVNKVLLEYSHIHSFIYCPQLFLSYKQHSWEVVRKSIWPEKPKVVPFWHFPENFADSCLQLLKTPF